MASQPGRQRPDNALAGPDPDYHPNKDGYWDKDAMLNNCSAMQLTAVGSISNWEKFFEYFWTPKDESQQLQTPGMIIVTLTERQEREQLILLRQGFTILHHFPSCHGGYLNTVFVKNNPKLSGEDNKAWQGYLQAGKAKQARLMQRVEEEEERIKEAAEAAEIVPQPVENPNLNHEERMRRVNADLLQAARQRKAARQRERRLQEKIRRNHAQELEQLRQENLEQRIVNAQQGIA